MVTGSAAASAGLILEGTVFEGRFEIERRIAEGGFAVVYKARQVMLNRPVALKVLKGRAASDDVTRADFRQKFAIEAQTIARLRHPHIVDVYDFAVSALPGGDLAAWMALEWLDGETLATRLARRRAAGATGLPPREALALLRPVIEALAHAHDHGVVHRDVKPANIMVTPTAHGESVRVLDFGIAKIVAADELPRTGHTRTESAPAFSPSYAAPEQVAFSRTGAWTDVHALGLVLGELMTDEAPFADNDPEAHLFERVMDRERPTPARKGKDVGAFEPVLAKAVALSPRDRWRNAGEMLAALERASRTPDGAAPRAGAALPRRTPRRRTLAGAVLAAAALVAAVGWRRHQETQPLARIPHPRPSLPPAPIAPSPPPVPPAPGRASSPPTPPAAPLDQELRLPPPKRASLHRRRPEPSQAEPPRPEPPKATNEARDLFDDTK